MQLVKKLAQVFIQPVIRKRIHRTSIYRWKDIELHIPPGIFHPAYFFSTKYLLQKVLNQDLVGKTLLELGAGNGLISIVAAKQKAIVTATDISERVVTLLKENSKSNEVDINIILSNLFEKIPVYPFNFIAINPPYYPKEPRNEFEQAWYCGEHFEYFENLFAGLDPYLNYTSKVLMVLSEECDLKRISSIAHKNNFRMEVDEKKRIYWEMNYIFEITKI